MGACPKHRISRMSKRKRRTHVKVPTLTLAKCPQCFETKLPHRVCPSCGYYNKKVKVLEVAEQK
jgi:large subunit ribosomal protein L32